MFDNETVSAVAGIAARINVESAALLAVAEIESAGKAYARVKGRNEPLIRFEGHYFDRRLSATERKAARAAGLASPKAGAIANPSKQEDRWKLLDRATDINAAAALESVSWGVGQVMGAHWKLLGFASVTELVNLARRDVAGQVEIMARFIEVNPNLAAALRKKDWAKFARGYNGSGYKANRYDTKMAAAYTRLAKEPPAVAPPAPVEPVPVQPQRYTDKATIERVQTRLKELGYSEVGGIDGKIGDLTRTAILAFRNENGLPVIDTIDDELLLTLSTAKPRKLAPERTEAPPSVVHDKIPEAKMSFWSKVISFIVGAPAAAIGLVGGSLEYLGAAKGYIDPIKEGAADIPGYVWIGGVVAVSVVLFLLSRRGEAKSVEAFQSGERR